MSDEQTGTNAANLTDEQRAKLEAQLINARNEQILMSMKRELAMMSAMIAPGVLKHSSPQDAGVVAAQSLEIACRIMEYADTVTVGANGLTFTTSSSALAPSKHTVDVDDLDGNAFAENDGEGPDA